MTTDCVNYSGNYNNNNKDKKYTTDRCSILFASYALRFYSYGGLDAKNLSGVSLVVRGARARIRRGRRSLRATNLSILSPPSPSSSSQTVVTRSRAALCGVRLAYLSLSAVESRARHCRCVGGTTTRNSLHAVRDAKH